MKTIKGFSGKIIPVSDEWYAANVTAFPGIEKLNYAQVKGTITGLHRKEAARAEAKLYGALRPDAPLLTDHETALIDACTGVMNMNARHVALNGRDLKQTYGEEVPMDVLGYTNWRPDTCQFQCDHRILFRLDHGGEGQSPQIHYPHMTFNRCSVHAHLTDHVDHYTELKTENDHKNHTVNTVGEVLGVHPGEVQWRHDGSRVLIVKHDLLAPRVAEVKKAIADHPVASTRPVNIE